MTRKKCPSCNAAFNGRRCLECGYEVFDEVEVHSHAHGEYGAADPWEKPDYNHYDTDGIEKAANHKGFTITVGEGKKNGTTYRYGKKKPKFTIVGLIAALVLIQILLSILGAVFMTIGDILDDIASDVEEETIAMPEQNYSLTQNDVFAIHTDREPGSHLYSSTELWVENFTDNEIRVYSRLFAVNSIMGGGSLNGYAGAGAIGKGDLFINEDWLNEIGIDQVESVQMHLSAYVDSDESYGDHLIEQQELTITTDDIARTNPAAPEGVVVLDRDGFRVVYLGCEKDEYGDFHLDFYLENNTDRTVSICSTSILADNQSIDASFWEELLPRTRTWAKAVVLDLNTIDVEEIRNTTRFACMIEVDDYYTSKEILTTELIEFERP